MFKNTCLLNLFYDFQLSLQACETKVPDQTNYLHLEGKAESR